MVAAEHIDDLLPGLALGALDADEEREARVHLKDCQRCAGEYRAYLETAGMLALAAPLVVPPARLRASLLRAARAGHSQPARQGWLASLTNLFRRPGFAWMAASLAMILVLAGGNLYQMRTRTPPPETQPAYQFNVIAMRGEDPASEAEGILVISPDGRYGTLVVDGLQPLTDGREYQLWLLADGSRVSGGVFKVGASGYGAMEVDAPRPLSEYSQFGITIEPEGGSPQPTGERVLGGGL